MRTRVYLGLLVLIVIIAATGVYLRLARQAGPADLGTQALIPCYGVIRYRPAETLDLSSGLLDTTVAGLFGSTENITAVKLWGPDGQVDVVDWTVSALSGDGQVGGRTPYVRHLQLAVGAPDRAMVLTDVEFSFANGMKKSFPFGELRLVPREETSPVDMAERVGALWEIQDYTEVSSISPGGHGQLAGLVVGLTVGMLERAPEGCSVTSIDLGYPRLEVDESSACIVGDAFAFEQAVQGVGAIADTCLTEDRGLPLPLVFVGFQPRTTNWVKVAFLLKATGPTLPPLATLYVHPQFVLSIGGEEIRVAATNCQPIGLGNRFSSEAADFLKEWGK